MLKWNQSVTQLIGIFQLPATPVTTWDSSPFSDSVFQISHSKTLFAVSKFLDLFDPSPKYVLKFSQFNPYLSWRQLLCSGWVNKQHPNQCLHLGLEIGTQPAVLLLLFHLLNKPTVNVLHHISIFYCSSLKMGTPQYTASMLIMTGNYILVKIWIQ